MQFVLKPGSLSYSDIISLIDENSQLSLNAKVTSQIEKSSQVVENILQQKKVVYGINTGFGALASTRINTSDLGSLQTSLVLSHAAGTGELLSDEIVRLILLLKINSLARAYSGVQLATINLLIKFFNHQIYPCIPAKGSVGASGDLAPLAHLAAALIGVGDVRYKNKIVPAKKILADLKLEALNLGPKEGLALINGTQVSTALAIFNLIQTERIFFTAITAGALTCDAARASDTPFDERIQMVRGHAGQIQVASMLRSLLKNSEIRSSHLDCQKIQDPYSLRCQPQVMGSCLTQLRYAADILLIEANAVSDNPLVFIEDDAVLSGGNFHAEPVAFAADAIAVAVAEIGAMSERRIALLIDPQFSHLPPFLVENAGVNSGFMLAQVTAAALTSENKSLAHPASVDNIPTSANQEDHVSMATFAARRLAALNENTATIVAIEILAACQGIDFLHPLKTSKTLETIHQHVREHIPFYAKDRFFAPDILCVQNLLQANKLIAKELARFRFLT